MSPVPILLLNSRAQAQAQARAREPVTKIKGDIFFPPNNKNKSQETASNERSQTKQIETKQNGLNKYNGTLLQKNCRWRLVRLMKKY